VDGKMGEIGRALPWYGRLPLRKVKVEGSTPSWGFVFVRQTKNNPRLICSHLSAPAEKSLFQTKSSYSC